jgi:hypothetical protein
MWNGTFFEQSDLLKHQLTIDLCHYPNNCPSIPESQMTFDHDISDETKELWDDHLLDKHQSSGGSGSMMHFGS